MLHNLTEVYEWLNSRVPINRNTALFSEFIIIQYNEI